MADTPLLSTDDVFVKTALGQQEIQQRTLRLGLLERRVLLLVDGQRTVGDLAALAGNADASALLAELVARGCIARTGTARPRAAPAGAAAAPTAARSDDPLATLPPASDRSAEQVEMARHFMINSVSRLMDPVMSAPFRMKIQACGSAAELRGYYAEWAQAVGAGWGGGKRLNELRPKLFEVL